MSAGAWHPSSLEEHQEALALSKPSDLSAFQAVSIQRHHGLCVQVLAIELDCHLLVLSLVRPDCSMAPPVGQDESQTEVAGQPGPLVNQSMVCHLPFLEQSVKVLHLPGLPVCLSKLGLSRDELAHRRERAVSGLISTEHFQIVTEVLLSQCEFPCRDEF